MYLGETRLKFYVREELIYSTYFPDFSLNGKFHSPFRDDPKPSLSFMHTGKSIVWRDFGMPKPKFNDAIAFVAELFGISRKQAVRKIWRELVKNDEVKLSVKKLQKPIKIDYEFIEGELRDWELSYWRDKYHISKELLEFYNVYSLRQLSRLQKVLWKSKKSSPAYIYLFGEEGVFKAYRPLDPDGDKFRGQNNGHIIEGWNQLPDKWEHLFITSSLKDTIVCRNNGVVACNPTSENSFRAILSKKEEINSRFDNVFILFDNDSAGEEAAKTLEKETGWTPTFIGKEDVYSEEKKKFAKDPSDTVEFSGDNLYLSDFFSKFVKQRYNNTKKYE